MEILGRLLRRAAGCLLAVALPGALGGKLLSARSCRPIWLGELPDAPRRLAELLDATVRHVTSFYLREFPVESGHIRKPTLIAGDPQCLNDAMRFLKWYERSSTNSGLYDAEWNIVVVWRRRADATFRYILAHELSHLLSFQLVSSKLGCIWADEGVAEWVARRSVGELCRTWEWLEAPRNASRIPLWAMLSAEENDKLSVEAETSIAHQGEHFIEFMRARGASRLSATRVVQAAMRHPGEAGYVTNVLESEFGKSLAGLEREFFEYCEDQLVSDIETMRRRRGATRDIRGHDWN